MSILTIDRHMNLVCPHCSATNRVPNDRLRDEPVCGRCKTELMPPNPVALGDTVFEAYIRNTEQPVVVDFWAEWCGPCKMMAPQFTLAAKQMPNVRFAKVDTEAAPATSARMNIRSIPTLALFKGGREIARFSGATSAGGLVQWIQGQLSQAA